MILTIITINLNNLSGLKKTMQSVLSQTRMDFEYVVVDGASTDGSIDIIRQFSKEFGGRMRWISEPDKGIYNAMNKGIRMATGDYLEFLNSGDCLVSDSVVGDMYNALEINGYPSLLYGDMLKSKPNCKIKRDKCFSGRDLTFLDFYTGTLNHSPTYIKKSLFEKYGLYDESLKIVSDWKWFLQAIILGNEKPVYASVVVSLFDITGISETNIELCLEERKQVLSSLIPFPILEDYNNWALSINHLKRIKRYRWASKLFWLIDRCLFKWEKIFRSR